jgi:hypothetical protein
VFKAYQPGLDRFVAVKVLSPGLAEQPGFTERFQREAHSVARLHHPHILEVYDFGVQDAHYYLVMRYVEDSRTLGDLIQEGASLNGLVSYIIQVADALNYAHERGIIHRDVKPSNILIDGKWALLSDFGLAKISESSSQLTGTGVGIGTPAFMSPEQAAGASIVDHRTDIYALGAILYRILTGTVPHDAPTPFAILARRVSEPVRPPRELNPSISQSLDSVVLRSLATEPDVRYSSAIQFAEALQKAETDPNYREESVPTLAGLEGGTAVMDKASVLGAATLAPEGKTLAAGQAARSGWKAAAWPKNLVLALGGAAAAVVVVGILLIFLFTRVLGGRGSAAQPTPSPVTPTQAEVAAPVPATATPTRPADTPTPIPPGTPSALAKADLEVRSGPGDAYDLLGFLPQGAVAEIVSRDRTGQWWQIKTSLAPAGLGWIEAGPEFAEAGNTANLPIALAPPTPTPVETAAPMPDTPTPTVPPPPPDTPAPTLTPTPSPRAVATQAPVSATATRAVAAAAGQFVLLKPTLPGNPSYGPTDFEWQWNGPLGPDQGFEVRVWREGEPPAGVHNSVEDNQSGKVVALGNNTFRLNVDIRDAAGVGGRSGEYWWTVALVQISPDYKDLGQQASLGRLRFEAGGDDGGGGGGGGGLNP